MLPKKILFATAPFDGHFSPLTGLAVHLKNRGHDVRWYTQEIYAPKLERLGIPHYGFQKADQINQFTLEALYPERRKLRSQIGKLNFDIQTIFVKQGPLYYQDITEIAKEFDFDLLIADCAFVGLPYVKELMNKPAFAIGVMPLNETSKDLPPGGLGMTPSYSFWGKIKQAALRYIAQEILFGASNRKSQQTFKQYGIDSKYFVFDEITRRSTLLLQSGCPGFEYRRSDLSPNTRFIGPLLPHSQIHEEPYIIKSPFKYDSIVLVTQGTVEKDVSKLLVPTLEAFRNTNTLVIATTGGSGTGELRARYPDENFVIEDFIPFDDVMPVCDAYITNGGYGGVMLGIQNKVPMVVAGVHEGKNEICARVGYFKIGINLKTERPTTAQIRKAVNQLAKTPEYKINIIRMAKEMSFYNPTALLDSYIAELFGERQMVKKPTFVTFGCEN